MPLHVIGLGVSEQSNLDELALAALRASNRVIGSERQLATVRWWLSEKQQEEVLPKLDVLRAQLQTQLANNETIALLASGDPLFFGIGKWVRQNFPSLGHDKLCFHAGISSIQAACHRLGWSLQDAEVISLHGRPLNTLLPKLKTNQQYILLTDKQSTPKFIAQVCRNSGFESAALTVCEKLGYADERIRQFSLAELLDGATKTQSFDPLNIVCLQTLDTTQYRPSFPGIPDHHFVTDKQDGKGMITKREVRLAILSLLEPSPEDCIWDIGAGCGGVATELALWGQGAQVYAIEHHPERFACLAQNQHRFGLEGRLHLTEGNAPESCHGLPPSNKVFIGGSGGELGEILKLTWKQLPIGGMLVASAVTENTRYALYAFFQQIDNQAEQDSTQEIVPEIETLEIAISRGERLAGELYYKPNLPVTLYKFVKKEALEHV